MRWRQMYFTLQTLPIWVVRWQDHRKKHFITSGNVMRQVLPSKALNIHKTLSWQQNKICHVWVYTFTDFLWLLCEWQCLYIFVYLIFFTFMCIDVFFIYSNMPECFFKMACISVFVNILRVVSLLIYFNFSISYKKIIKQIS